MAKKNISARIPAELFQNLQEMTEATGMDLTTVVTEALRAYLGTDVARVGDRLTLLEKKVAALEQLSLKRGRVIPATAPSIGSYKIE